MAHNGIATYYLDEFRRDAAAFAELHDAYGQRFLTGHLRAADRHRDLRRLLSPGSGWPRRGDAYTADLATELAKAGDPRPNLTADHESFRFEVFAGLYFAGQSATPGDVPVDLIDALLTWEVWTVDAAREQLDQVSNPVLRATGLLALARHAPDGDAVRATATALADQIQNDTDRIGVQTMSLAHLPPAEAAEATARLVASARQLPEPGEAGRLLLALMTAGADPGELFEPMLDLLRAEPDDRTRAVGLAAAVRFAPAAMVEALAAEALAATDDVTTPEELRDLLGFDDTQALARGEVAAILVDAVPAPLRPPLVAELRGAQLPLGHEWVGPALALARHWPASRDGLVSQAREVAAALSDPRLRAKAMLQVHDFLAEHG